MQIALAAAPPRSSAPPVGWSPGTVAPSTSTRTPGLLRGGLDAWRGVAEKSVGVALTGVQVAKLAPYLSSAFDLPVNVVRGDLRGVRVHVGGLAHEAGNVATTIGPDIYVSDASWATRMLSWSGRKWLVHELGHTMQWRKSAPTTATDAQRDRAFLNTYVGSFVKHNGKLSEGGFVEAIKEWKRRRDTGKPGGKPGDLLHDTHPMERQAERVAIGFDAARGRSTAP